MISAKVVKTYSTFKPGVFRQEMHAAALVLMANMTKDFNKTTRTWQHNVDFDGKVQDKLDEISVQVSTKDEIYGYVDKGTKPHIIKPRRGKLLAFKNRYKAKTTPRVINSHKGGASGKTVYAKVVHHPGTDAREFSHLIQAKYQPRLKKDIEAAITRAARRSGHATK